MTALGRMSSLSPAISGRFMECNVALLKSRLHDTARPSRVLYPPRSLKFGADSKLMCLGYDWFIGLLVHDEAAVDTESLARHVAGSA